MPASLNGCYCKTLELLYDCQLNSRPQLYESYMTLNCSVKLWVVHSSAYDTEGSAILTLTQRCCISGGRENRKIKRRF